MSGRKRPEDDISGPVDLLRMLLQSLENELPRALELRERLHMSPEPSQGEHATSGEAVAVRAGLDALPIQEETGSGGHDVNMASLAALFRAAGRIEGSLPRDALNGGGVCKL